MYAVIPYNEPVSLVHPSVDVSQTGRSAQGVLGIGRACCGSGFSVQ